MSILKNSRIPILITAMVFAMLGAFGLQTINAPVASACPGTQVFAVGGTGDPGAGYFPGGGNVHKVGYEASINFPSSVRNGIGNLKGAIYDHNRRCPGSHILVWGYSQGAWVAAQAIQDLNYEGFRGSLNAVLFGDPSQPGAGGGFNTGHAPVINNFGRFAVKRYCFGGDPICNAAAPATNYPGAHGGYNNTFGWTLWGGGSGVQWL